MSEVETIGVQPQLVGLTCDGLICQGFEYCGEGVSDADILFLLAGGIWHQLVIDGGVVFWRTQVESPQPFEIAEEGWRYPHKDVGREFDVLGYRFASVSVVSRDNLVAVRFGLSNGKSFAIENENDSSRFTVA